MIGINVKALFTADDAQKQIDGLVSGKSANVKVKLVGDDIEQQLNALTKILNSGSGSNTVIQQTIYDTKTASKQSKELNDAVKEFIKLAELSADKTGKLKSALKDVLTAYRQAYDTKDIDKQNEAIEQAIKLTAEYEKRLSKAEKEKAALMRKQMMNDTRSEYFPEGVTAVFRPEEYDELKSRYENTLRSVVATVSGGIGLKVSKNSAGLDTIANEAKLAREEGNGLVETYSKLYDELVQIKSLSDRDILYGQLDKGTEREMIEDYIRQVLQLDDAIKTTAADMSNLPAMPPSTATSETLTDNQATKERLALLGEIQDAYVKIGTLQGRAETATEQEKARYQELIDKEEQRIIDAQRFLDIEGLATKEVTEQIRQYSQIASTMAKMREAGINASDEGYVSNSLVRSSFSSLEEAKAYFEQFKQSAIGVKEITENIVKNGEQDIKQFTISLKGAHGEMEKFTYAAREAGEEGLADIEYHLRNITAANAGVIRLAESQEKWNAQIEVTRTKLTAQLDAAKAAFLGSNDKPTGYVSTIDNLTELKDTYGAIQERISRLNSAIDQNAFKVEVADIQKLITELKTSTSEYHKQEEAIKRRNAEAQKQAEIQKKWNAELEATRTKLTAQADAIQTGWQDKNGNKSVSGTDNVDKLNSEYGKLISTIKTLENVDRAAASKILGNIQAQITALKALNTQLHNEEKVATELRSKDIGSTISKYSSDISAFLTKVSTLGQGTVAALTDDIARLNIQLESTRSEQTAESLTKLLNVFDEVKARFRDENSITQSLDKISKSSTEAIKSLRGMAGLDIYRNFANNAEVEKFKNDLDELIKKYIALRDATGNNAARTPESVKQLSTELETLSKKLLEAKEQNDVFKQSLRDEKAFATAQKNAKTLTTQITAFMDENGKAARKYSTDFQNLLSGATAAFNTGDTAAVRELSTQFEILKARIIQAGDAGATFSQRLIKGLKSIPLVSMYLSITSLSMRAVRGVKTMINAVTELDTSMTALKRVTDETGASYDSFLTDTANRAVELHTTMTDLVDQTTAWVKLGNSIGNANVLAEYSMMFSRVADVDNETAVKNMISTMKAFNIEAEDSIRIVDMLDKLNNEFATSAAELGSGLAKTASSMAVAGNSLEKTVAILTGGTEITQNADEMATAMRTISMRIRSMKGELQDLGEEYENVQSISKIQGQILKYTGVNIFDGNGSFRDTYDILLDISKVYNDLADPAKADLTEILFGKLRANQGAAILQAFQTGQIQKAYEAAANSAGTATKEFEKYSESIQAHINSFDAAKQGFAEAVVDDKTIRNFVDAGTTALQTLTGIVKQLGTIQTILPVIFGSLSLFKNVGIFRTVTDQLTGATNQIAIFGRTWNNIVTDLGRSKGLKGKLGALFNFITNDEKAKLQEYSTFLKDGTYSAEMFRSAMLGTSTSARVLGERIIELNAQLRSGAISAESYDAQVNAMTAAQTRAGAAAQVMGAAIRTALNIGVSLLISSIITAIQEYANAQEYAAEKAKEAAQELEKNAKALTDYIVEIEALKTELDGESTSQERANELRKELKTIQDDLIKNYGLEAEGIDLVNGKLEEQIAKIKDRNRAEYEDYYSKNSEQINKAVKAINQATINIQPFTVFDRKVTKVIDDLDKMQSKGELGNVSYYSGKRERLGELSGDIYSVDKALKQLQDSYKDTLDKDKELTYETRKELQEAYDYVGYLRRSIIDEQTKDKYEDMFEQWLINASDYSDDYYKLVRDRANLEKAIESGAQEDIAKMRERYLEDYNNAVEKARENDPAAASYIGETFKDAAEETKAVAKQTATDIYPVREALNGLNDDLESLKETYDAAFSNQSTIQSAFDKIKEGTSLTAKEVRELIDLYPQLATKFEKTADGYKISAGELIKANNDILNSTKGSIRAQINGYQEVIDKYEEYLRAAEALKHSNVAPADIGITEEQYENAKNEINKLKAVIEMLNIPLADAAKNSEELKKKFDELSKASSSLASNAKTLSSAFKEQNENGSITIDTALDLIDKGYAAAVMFDKETGAIRLNADAYLKLAEAELTAHEAALQSQISEAQLDMRKQAANVTANLGWQSLQAAERMAKLGEVEAAIAGDEELIASLEKQVEAIRALKGELGSVTAGTYGDTSGSGSKKEEDTVKKGFEAQMKEVEHLHNMGKLTVYKEIYKCI